LEIVPVAERMHIARDPCCENDMIFMVTSWYKTIRKSQKQVSTQNKNEIKTCSQ